MFLQTDLSIDPELLSHLVSFGENAEVFATEAFSEYAVRAKVLAVACGMSSIVAGLATYFGIRYAMRSRKESEQVAGLVVGIVCGSVCLIAMVYAAQHTCAALAPRISFVKEFI